MNPSSGNYEISLKKLKTYQESFQKINRARLQRVLGELRPNQQDYIQLIPLLFHINHPTLPGFVSSDAPAGIPNFDPTREALNAARKLSRSFSYKGRAYHKYLIQGLYLMGSSGTIGHTRSSDFDFWLCYDPKLTDPEIELLQDKATSIEKFGAGLDLEIHVFIMDVESFRRGDKAALSRDSSGSTQHDLLLEEFYRSGLLLAGRYPLWWLVPPEEEGNYHSYAAKLLEQRFVDDREVLDFGGLDELSADEFLGAALWQLFKGIESPYKSVLKILLMESYAQDYPSPRWLAQQAKAAIYAGETDLSNLDAYIMMYRQLETYLESRNELDRLDLVRRSLYFKVGRPLSKISRLRHWCDREIAALTEEWGWDEKELKWLDSRPEWKINSVLRERSVLVKELSHSYRLLTDFVRAQSGSNPIKPGELNLIGRKLYTALERRPGKIDRINPGISQNMLEPKVSIHYSLAVNGEIVWMLFRGQVDGADRPEHKVIKAAPCLLELLTWCHINQICDSKTTILLYPEDGPITLRELRSMLRVLQQLYPDHQLPESPLEALAESPRLRSIVLVVNVGVDPLESLSKEGVHLTSIRSDVLSYGALHKNLVLNTEQLIHTSWEELLVSRWSGITGLLDSICNYLGLAHELEYGEPLPEIKVFSFSVTQAMQIAERISSLFKEISQYFLRDTRIKTHFIFQAEDAYYMIQRDGCKGDHHYSWIGFDAEEDLLEALQQFNRESHLTVFDPLCMQETPYPILFQHNCPDRCQIFCYSSKGSDESRIYLLDEQGVLFRYRVANSELGFSLVQMNRFLSSLQSFRAMLPGERALINELEVFSIVKTGANDWDVERESLPRQGQMQAYTELRLITDLPDGHSTPRINLVCGEQEFASLVYGDNLYIEAAKHIKALRHESIDYPIYLTAVEFTQFSDTVKTSTAAILQLKQHIEEQLTQAMLSI
jgi:adenylate cyclase class 1